MVENKTVRVAHIVGKMVGGGVESFLMNYYRYINRDKIQFDFIIDSDSTYIPRKEIEELGGNIIFVPPYQHVFKYIKELIKIFKKNNYRIVHSHLNVLSVFPLLSAYIAKIPIRIAHSHSTSNKKEWKKNLIKNFLKPFSKLFATDYFACSEHAARWLFGNYAFENGKVTIINNAIDIEKFGFNLSIRNKIREKLNIKDKFVVGHMGRFTEQKNHIYLIDIFKEIYYRNSNAILILCGTGHLENEIKQKVEELKLTDNVIFLGVINNPNEVMCAMDVFILPSLYEGLGIVLIETQCSGLYTLCSTAVPKIVGITDNIKFIDLNNKEKFVELALNANNDRQNCFDAIDDAGYNIKKEVRKLEEIYLERIQNFEKN